MFGSLRIDDARFGVVNLFVIFKAINRDRYIIDAINNRERLRKIAFPNVSDQFIFCKTRTAGAPSYSHVSKRPSIPIPSLSRYSFARTRWRLSNVTPDTGKERTPCVASNSRRRASASACARASSSCFKRASAAALRAFFSLENPTRARTTATATPEANSPIPSGRKVKEHKRKSVAATKRAIEDFSFSFPFQIVNF